MSDVYQAPEASLQEPSAGQYGSVENAIAGNYELDSTELIKRAWANLKGIKTTFWIAAVIYFLVAMAFSLLPLLLFGSLEPDPNASGAELAMFYGLQLVQVIVVMPIAMGMMMVMLKHTVGVKAQVGEIFKHFDKTIPLFITYILMVIAVLIGFLLFIIPGIYLAVALWMSFFLVVEKDMGPIEALNTSRKAISKKWFSMFGFMIVSSIVMMLGALALGIGLIWTVPLVSLAYAYAYRDMFGVEAKTLND